MNALARRLSTLLRRHPAASIFCTVLLLYSITIPGNHTETEDAYDYAFIVRTGDTAGLLHPHHLLPLPALRSIFLIGRFHDAFTLMVGVDVILGAATVGLVWKLARERMQLSARAAAFTCAFLAFSYGFWRYSVAAEVYIPAMFTQVLLCWVAFSPRPSRMNVVVVSVAAVLTLLAHAPLGAPLAVLAVPFHYLRQRRYGTLLLYGAISSAMLLSTVYAAFLLHPATANSRFVVWAKGPAEEVERLSLASFLKVPAGFGPAFLGTNYLFASPRIAAKITAALPRSNLTEETFLGSRFSPATAAGGVATTASLFALAFFVAARLRWSWPAAKHATAGPRGAILVWNTASMLMIIATKPESPELWVCFLLPLALSCGSVVDTLYPSRSLTTPLAFVSLLFIHNLCFGIAIIRSADGDYNAVKGRWVIENCGPSDTILTRDNEVFTRYLRYYAAAQVINCRVAGAAETYEIIEQAQRGRGRVFLFNDVLHPAAYLLHERVGLSAELEQFSAMMAGRLNPTAIPSVWVVAQ